MRSDNEQLAAASIVEKYQFISQGKNTQHLFFVENTVQQPTTTINQQVKKTSSSLVKKYFQQISVYTVNGVRVANTATGRSRK